MKSAILIGQSHARYGERELIAAGEELRRRGIAIAASHLETGHKALRKRIRGAVKSGAELIVVCGGDGTLSVAVAAMCGSGAILGVVPAGTGNSFATSLGVGESPHEAFDAIAYGRLECIDLGVVNGHHFANFATIGLAAEIGDRTPRWLKKIAGPIAYGAAAVLPILKQRPFRARVCWKKNKLKIETRQIIVVSGRDYGHTPIAPEATLTNGTLTFFASTRTSTFDVLRTNAALILGRHTGLPDVHYFQAPKIAIRTSRRVPVAVDGTTVCKTPATFGIEPRALRVMVRDRSTVGGA